MLEYYVPFGARPIFRAYVSFREGKVYGNFMARFQGKSNMGEIVVGEIAEIDCFCWQGHNIKYHSFCHTHGSGT